MKKLVILFLFLPYSSFTQESRFSLEANYGLAGNNFVNRYIENGEGWLPEGYVYIADKDFLGTVGQIQLNYHFKNETQLSIGYARDSHQAERDYANQIGNSIIVIENWSLRHNNNIFFIKHKRHLSKSFNYHFGGFVLHPEQQEITIWERQNGLELYMDERDLPNNNLADGGILGGFDYERKIDTKFIAGLHLSGYYLASASTYETTYLTGSLAYRFQKKKHKN